MGAIALGAIATDAVAVGRLAIGRARFCKFEIDELVVGYLRVAEKCQPAPHPTGKTRPFSRATKRPWSDALKSTEIFLTVTLEY